MAKKKRVDVKVPDELIKPDVQLIGKDGNAFSILSTVKKALREAGNSKEVIEAYDKQAMFGSYDHMLQVSMEFCNVS